MKKSILSVVMLLTAIMLSATPSVTISVDSLTNLTITCSFVKNSDCTTYYIVASEPQNVDPWIGSPYAAPTIEETIEKWGIKYTKNATYTWTEMKPNTKYVIYVTAKSNDTTRVLCTDTIYTQKGGGQGASVITLNIADITDNGVTTTATPNDQTMMFKDLLFEKSLYDTLYSSFAAKDSLTADSLTKDSIFSMLKGYYYEYYVTDQWVWNTLKSGTDYMFVAAGMNADSVWGEMASVSFKTTGEPSAVENVELNSITVYPNPATDIIHVNGVTIGEIISVVDLRGNILLQQEATSCDTTINLSGLVPGLYLLKTDSSVQRFIVR